MIRWLKVIIQKIKSPWDQIITKSLCPQCGAICFDEARGGIPVDINRVFDSTGNLVDVRILCKCPGCQTTYSTSINNIEKPENWVKVKIENGRLFEIT